MPGEGEFPLSLEDVGRRIASQGRLRSVKRLRQDDGVFGSLARKDTTPIGKGKVPSTRLLHLAFRDEQENTKCKVGRRAKIYISLNRKNVCQFVFLVLCCYLYVLGLNMPSDWIGVIL